MSVEEVVVSATQSGTSIHDIATGSVLFSFKGQGAASSTTSSSASSENPARPLTTCVSTRDGLGGVLLGSAGGKSAIYVWSYQKEVPIQRFISPAFLTQLSLSNRGHYLLAGTNEGRILVWEVGTGLLLAALDAHYRPVTAIAWTDDDAAFFSASEDGSGSIWSLASVFTAQGTLTPPTPYCVFSDHTLAITSVAIGLGVFPRVRVVTGSKDGTCKIWDPSNPSHPLLTTLMLGDAPTSSSDSLAIKHIAFETGERFLLASTSNKIYRIDLYRRTDASTSTRTVFEPVGGKGHLDVERISGDGDEDSYSYTSSEPITYMYLSSYSSILLVGTSDSKVVILNLPSLQPIRIIKPLVSSSGAITYLKTMMRPSDLTNNGKLSDNRRGTSDNANRFGHANGRNSTATSGIVNADKLWPVRVVGQLQKSVVPRAEKIRKSIPIKINNTYGQDRIPTLEPLRQSSNFSYDEQNIIQLTSASFGGTRSNEDQSLELENKELREKLARAVEFNDQMWRHIVDKKLE